MSKKIIIVCIMLAMILGISVIHQPQNSEFVIPKQHEIYRKENKETVGLKKDGSLSSHLPIFIIESNGQVIPGSSSKDTRKLLCEYRLIDNESGVNSSSDKPVQDGSMYISIRGNSSRYLPKKQYSIKTLDKHNNPDSVSFIGMPSDTTWVLNGSYIDKSLIRNYMMMDISSEIMSYSPKCRLCEVMIRDSQGNLSYEGVYSLMEKPKVSKSRLNLTPYDKKYSQTSFLIQINARIDNYEIKHLKPDSMFSYHCDLEYPDIEAISDKSLQYIQGEITTVEKALYDAIHSGDWKTVEKYIDIDTFVDYYIINEFFQNYDAGSLSTYLYQNLGGKLCIGPVWDFDGAMNNFRREIPIESLRLQETLYYYYLTQSPTFIYKCNSRYRSLRKNVLSDEYLIKYIDEASQYLGSAVKRNADRWYNGDIESFNTEIKQMKEFVKARGTWLDEHLSEMSAIVNMKGA